MISVLESYTARFWYQIGFSGGKTYVTPFLFDVAPDLAQKAGGSGSGPAVKSSAHAKNPLLAPNDVGDTQDRQIHICIYFFLDGCSSMLMPE